MEAGVIKAFTGEIRQQIFAELGVVDATDLGGFENFVYATDDRIVRIVHDSHRNRDELLAELAFLDALMAADAPVAGPLPTPSVEKLISVDSFHASLFQAAPGQPLAAEPYSAAVVKNWGATLAQFHRVAQAGLRGLHRADWQSDANHDFAARTPAKQVLVLERASEMMDELATLPRSHDVYGLIHSDAHPGNFFVDADNRLTVFDFDDCLYAWYGYDVATVLFGVLLQPWVADDKASQQQATVEFLLGFLEGYSQFASIDGLMLDQMPLLLKLREFSLYAVLHAHEMDGVAEQKINRFLLNRQARLEQRVPFVDFDFTRLL